MVNNTNIITPKPAAPPPPADFTLNAVKQIKMIIIIADIDMNDNNIYNCK
jgi:hypothetical protein